MKPIPDITADAEVLAIPAAATSAAAADATPSRLADLCELTKLRLNALVLVTTMVGFYMAQGTGRTDWLLVLYTLLGTALTAAGASVLNQYAEREIDGRMRRTANRPLPAGRVAPLEALLLGVGLSIAGVLLLTLLVNPLTATLGVVTLSSYVFVYTPLKRYTTFNTVVGAVPGAIPPVMGWTAAGGEIGPAAWALFAILFFWQMPHFLAIATLYRDDYAAGGLRMLPVVDEAGTGRQIVLWSSALIPVSLFPAVIRMAGPGYFIAAVTLGLLFFGFAVRCAITRERADAKRLFLASVIYLPLLLSAMMGTKVS